MENASSLLRELIDHGHYIPMGVDGLYGKSGTFEAIVDGISAMVSRYGGHQNAEVMRFPPAIAQRTFERSAYLKSFPHLAGTVHCFCGDERAHLRLLEAVAEGADWTADQKSADIVLTPAACYPAYPTVASRGALGTDGHAVDVFSYCYRHEPSLEPTRLQLFRMREYVRMGSPDQVIAFREEWLDKGQDMIRALELPLLLDVANDPFFGRAGRILADNQRSQKLKFELLVPINSPEQPTACLSFNYHTDHFGELWDLKLADGGIAHTACVGFGMERITIALLKHHGFDLARWPAGVRAALSL